MITVRMHMSAYPDFIANAPGDKSNHKIEFKSAIAEQNDPNCVSMNVHAVTITLDHLFTAIDNRISASNVYGMINPNIIGASENIHQFRLRAVAVDLDQDDPLMIVRDGNKVFSCVVRLTYVDGVLMGTPSFRSNLTSVWP